MRIQCTSFRSGREGDEAGVARYMFSNESIALGGEGALYTSQQHTTTQHHYKTCYIVTHIAHAFNARHTAQSTAVHSAQQDHTTKQPMLPHAMESLGFPMIPMIPL